MGIVGDVALGVILLYLLLALIVTTLQELLASALHLRAKHLYDAIAGLLVGDVSSGGAPGAKQPLLAAFYEHPLIRNLNSRTPQSLREALAPLGRGLPSYIPSRTFALALLDVLRGTKGAADAVGAATLLANAKDLAAKVSDPDLKRILTLLLGDGELLARDLNERSRLVSERVEGWFNDRMARASGTYKRYSQLWSLALALLVTILCNADTLHVVSALWADEALRSAVVASAHTLVQAPPGPEATVPQLLAEAEQLARSGLPVGWHSGIPFRTSTVLGWLLTAVAVSLGASFWFDVLNKVLRVRGTGLKISAITGRVEARAS
ncbi:MAG: hypothetical protein EOO73_36205 [Myxococcales bacterium]|nr:MAG: hypothetical protein EOO73_36205 [Myxococcales bacterium]